MFTGTDIQARVKKQPFTPVRIITSAGEQYDIYHPDLVMVGVCYLMVGTASEGNPSIFDKSSMISVGQITAIEHLPTPPVPESASPNGQ